MKRKNSTDSRITHTYYSYCIPDHMGSYGIYGPEELRELGRDKVVARWRKIIPDRLLERSAELCLQKQKRWVDMKHKKFNATIEPVGWFYTGFAVPHLVVKIHLVRKDEWMNRLPKRDFCARDKYGRDFYELLQRIGKEKLLVSRLVGCKTNWDKEVEK